MALQAPQASTQGHESVCTSFHNASTDLCASIARLTRRLCTFCVHPLGISALTACRLIALDNCPGVRPIGVGETLRRLISKATLRVTRDIIQRGVGNLQLCAGQEQRVRLVSMLCEDSWKVKGLKLLFWLMLLTHSTRSIESLP